MNAKLEDTTVLRIQSHTSRPIARGIDKALVEVLDKLDRLENSLNRGDVYD